jgi:hypothetical protein
MSKKRYVDTKFWDDNYIIEKDPIEKLLFLYLLTNTLTNIIGIYEISTNRIAFDTGIDREMVDKILKRFEEDDKIKYENGWVAIKNFTKHQLNNPKINAGIEALSREVPKDLIRWANIDRNRLSKIVETVDNSIDIVDNSRKKTKKLKKIDYRSLSHPNLNLNTNLNPNINKEREEVRNQVSASLKEKTEKRKANNIEFDQELLSWHGVDEDIFDDWVKRFPNIDVPVELMKIREHFKMNPKKEGSIKNFAIYINDWLERAEKYRMTDKE